MRLSVQYWLDAAWDSLRERDQEILTRRAEGEALAVIGDDLDVTRERVRQVQSKCGGALLAACKSAEPELANRIHSTFETCRCASDTELLAIIDGTSDAAKRALLAAMGLVHPRLGSERLNDWWCLDKETLLQAVRALGALAPMSDSELRVAADDLGIPAELLTDQILQDVDAALRRHELGWIRPGRSTRDIAYLWLREQSAPQTPGALAAYVGTKDHTIMENLRRDEAFAQVRPEGTWALADWHVDGADSRYATAVDVVVEVLRDLGPLSYEQLKKESQRRYPVSDARIKQCLISNLIGTVSAGRYDLIERGATAVEEPEPRQPTNIEASGQVVGVKLGVDYNMLRGSGIAVHRWLTWYLGLRSAPSTRRFALQGVPDGEISVTRGTSNAQISSLRAEVLRLGAVSGCRIVLLLNTNDRSASVQHGCPTGACPAGGPGQ